MHSFSVESLIPGVAAVIAMTHPIEFDTAEVCASSIAGPELPQKPPPC
jgi:hypothetical protein